MTMIKEAETALAEMNVELERRVRDRTEELNASLKELSEKTEELEQFVESFPLGIPVGKSLPGRLQWQ